MREFNAFIIKEFYHIFRDTRSMLILLAMPIIQILIFGFAITTEVKNIKIAVYAPCQTNTTRTLTNKIKANELFDSVVLPATPEEAEDLLRREKVDVILSFDEEFDKGNVNAAKNRINLAVNASSPNSATTIVNYITSLLQQGDNPINKDYISVKLLYNPTMKGAYNFVPGVMGLILMLICAMMTSISIVREKERGTLEILLVSPIRPLYIIIAKAVPYFVLSVINLISILVLSVYVLHVPIAGSLWVLIPLSLLFILVSLALGLLISTMATTQIMAMILSGMVLMMPVMVLSGMLFPIESMPVALQWLSNFIPARWYISAVRKVMIQGVDVIYIAKELIILVAMAIVLLTVSLKKFKIRL